GVSAGDTLTLGIRPEHLVLDEAGPLTGRIQVIERLGGVTSLYLEHGDSEWILVADGNVAHRVHDEVRFTFDPACAHLFTAEGLALAHLTRHPLADIDRKENRASFA
ncbi:TOBE domain-containing protein, partial [Chromohalobacter israelensis]